MDFNGGLLSRRQRGVSCRSLQPNPFFLSPWNDGVNHVSVDRISRPMWAGYILKTRMRWKSIRTSVSFIRDTRPMAHGSMLDCFAYPTILDRQNPGVPSNTTAFASRRPATEMILDWSWQVRISTDWLIDWKTGCKFTLGLACDGFTSTGYGSLTQRENAAFRLHRGTLNYTRGSCQDYDTESEDLICAKPNSYDARLCFVSDWLIDWFTSVFPNMRVHQISPT